MGLMRGYENDVYGFDLDVCNRQGILFESSQLYDKYPCDAEDFVTKFMKSDFAKDMDGELSNCHVWGDQQFFDEIFLSYTVKPFDETRFINPDIMYWIGYLTRYWNFWLGTSSAEIITKFPFPILVNAYGLHTVGPQEAIQQLILA